MLRLSQGQLTLLEYCPRRFQHTVLDSLIVPPSPELLEGQQWGDRFHLLMQQREIGLTIDPVLAHDEELQTCLTRLEVTAPDLFDPTGETFRQSEYERSLIFNGYWFTAIYDLLRQWRDRAEIIDWKTYLKPPGNSDLRRAWQTRLYLYILAETSDYSPDQLSMTYWFVRAQNPETKTQEPQQVRIPYSEASHQQTRDDLKRLTNQLTQLLDTNYAFPQVAPGSTECETCPFAVRCRRGFANTSKVANLPDLEAIEEIKI